MFSTDERFMFLFKNIESKDLYVKDKKFIENIPFVLSA